VSALTILCVDDERIVLRGLKEQLRRHMRELRVETAESGDEALEVFRELRERERQVPLVISDQLMPGMRGEEFLAQIHELEPETLNVLLTGQANADAVGAAVNRANLYRYIGKPWSEDDLVMTVREALKAWEQQRAIKEKERELVASHESSLRFVPREFLGLLGRERLVDVRFGDHVEREMNILFSDMRGFTTVIESKSPADAFDFVNDYVQRAERPIRAHGGFICNIEGDAILALFPASADDAVAAGIETHEQLRLANAQRESAGDVPVGMGIGVNTGKLLLGTVGGEDRLQCDVVGDAVNLGARIESLTKLYATPMLISQVTKDRLTSDVALREVDTVEVKGKTQAIALHEVLDALPEPERVARQETSTRFAEGLQSFRDARIEDAQAAFADVLAANDGDGAAQVFIARCEELLEHGVPSGFDGVTRLDRK
jgi:class 3 adenylate cyclase